MRVFRTPRYLNVQELLDTPGEATPHDLRHTLRDIRRANIFGLGTWVVRHHLSRLVEQVPNNQTLTVLDLATGSADIPEELCRWADSTGRRAAFTATDISSEILSVARERIQRVGFSDRVTFVACDAARTPFPDRSFDVVICSLAFHHFDLDQAHEAMSEMARLSRLGFIINDIYRSQGAWLMAWALTRLTTTNRLTRHDGPASVYRAFTPWELRRIGRNSGVPVSIHTHPFWRVAVVGNSGGQRGTSAHGA
jgi:2-polyprenyl-3-methyl-5-hydroxy-6-metoxy-1,4-benzoquinol methylase